MAEDKNYTNTPLQEDELEIDLMEYARKLWAARKLLLKVAGVAFLLALVIHASLPTKYTAKVMLASEGTKGGASSLSGMAAMLGFGNFNGGTDASALNFSMASDIVASTPFILELFDTPVQTIDGKMDTTIVAYLETESKPWWNTLMALPSKAIGGIKSLFASKDEVVGKEVIDPFRLTPSQMGRIVAIKSIIKAEIDKKSSMTTISVTLQDPLIAATMVDTVVVKLQKYITNYQVSKAQEDCEYCEQLYKERQNDYYTAQKKYAEYMDANKNVILQRVRSEEERLQNEMNLAYQVYSNVATQLQMARAKVQETKPSFTVFEPASVPLYPSGLSAKILILGLVFLAVMAASAWVLFGKDLWASLKEGLKEPSETKKD